MAHEITELKRELVKERALRVKAEQRAAKAELERDAWLEQLMAMRSKGDARTMTPG